VIVIGNTFSVQKFHATVLFKVAQKHL